MRMLAALKACMEMYTAPRDTTLNANAYLHGGQILWTIEGLLPDGEENADHESIDRLEQRDRGGVEELIPAEEAIKGNIQVGE